MKRQAAIIASLALIALLSARSAHASLIYLGEYTIGPPPLTGEQGEADWIEAEIPLDYDLVFLSKYNYGDLAPWKEGAVAPGEDYFDPGTGGDSTTISWDLTGTGYVAEYVLIKDGSTGGGGNLYRLYEVSNTEEDDQSIVGSGEVGFDGKNISHVSWFGTMGEDIKVPDGGTTLALLGSALIGLGVLRRKFRA